MDQISVPAEWSWEELSRELYEANDPGPEYKSSAELEEIWGIKRAAVLSRIRMLEKAGRIEKKKRTILRTGNSPIAIPVYRILPKE
jgi:hypothetical protein